MQHVGEGLRHESADVVSFSSPLSTISRSRLVLQAEYYGLARFTELMASMGIDGGRVLAENRLGSFVLPVGELLIVVQHLEAVRKEYPKARRKQVMSLLRQKLDKDSHSAIPRAFELCEQYHSVVRNMIDDPQHIVKCCLANE